MKIPLQFSYHGQPVKAELIYNFKEISDAIMIKLLFQAEDFDESLLFVKIDNKNWEEATRLSVNCPMFFNALTQKLAANFKDEGFCFYKNGELIRPDMKIKAEAV